ncbi:MAG: hypothetical protein OEZ02_10710 [Anaerolineae bacterium]|nr:hypothetical protein [Anaerolineae bacterium]
MSAVWFSILALLAINLGFAGFFGALLQLARHRPSKSRLMVSLAFGTLFFLPVSLAMYFVPYLPAFAWVGSAALVVLYTWQPEWMPAWLHTPVFGLYYAGVTMGLILLWSTVNFLSPTKMLLGILAALAGILAWQRGRVWVS